MADTTKDLKPDCPFAAKADWHQRTQEENKIVPALPAMITEPQPRLFSRLLINFAAVKILINFMNFFVFPFVALLGLITYFGYLSRSRYRHSVAPWKLINLEVNNLDVGHLLRHKPTTHKFHLD